MARDAGLDDVALEASRPRLPAVEGDVLVFRSPGATIPEIQSDRAAYDAVRLDPAVAEAVVPVLGGHPYCDVGRLRVPEPSAA